MPLILSCHSCPVLSFPVFFKILFPFFKKKSSILFFNQPVLGLPFDGALATIVGAPGPLVALTFFRGGVSNLYGNLGPAPEWLNEFLAKPSA